MKKIIGFIICILLITASGFAVIGIEKDNEKELNKKHISSNLEYPPLTGLFEWTMFRYGLNNSGYSPSPAPDDDTILWSKEFTYEIKSNPTIKDEKLYIVDNTLEPLGRGGDLHCLNAFTGKKIWKADQWDDEVWGSPTIANDRVYVLGIAYNLYCYDANNGDLLWDFESYGHCSPMVVDDKVYFGSYGGGFYCLNATTGDTIWEFDTSTDYQGCTPAIVNGKVYVGNDDDIFYCLDADTGDKIWNYSTGRIIWSSPSIFNNKVYFASDQLYCLNATTGDEVWTVSGILTDSSPAVAYGNVYIGNGPSDGKFYCFDADDGELIWDSQSLGFIIWNGAAVADGKVYVCSSGDPARFNCFDAYTGDIIWQYTFVASHIYSSPAVAYGNVYVGSGEDGYIYAFGTPNEPPETPIKPEGSSVGYIGVEYSFNSSTTDPEDDDVYLLFDWDDGSDSGWLGPFTSGAIVTTSHKWAEEDEYEIKVKAHDGRRESDWSKRHTITIIGEDLECDGSLIWNDVKPGDTVTGNFTVKNIGSNGTLIDWEVVYWPKWEHGSSWVFTPISGENLTPEGGPVTVIVTFKTPDVKNKELESVIKVQNLEDPDDFCTIDVSLTTPKNKGFNFSFPFLMWLFEQFPNAFPILRYLFRL